MTGKEADIMTIEKISGGLTVNSQGQLEYRN